MISDLATPIEGIDSGELPATGMKRPARPIADWLTRCGMRQQSRRPQ
jgi:hypothetical protein